MIIHALSNLKWMDEAHLCSKQTNKQTNEHREHGPPERSTRIKDHILLFFILKLHSDRFGKYWRKHWYIWIFAKNSYRLLIGWSYISQFRFHIFWSSRECVNVSSRTKEFALHLFMCVNATVLFIHRSLIPWAQYAVFFITTLKYNRTDQRCT